MSKQNLLPCAERSAHLHSNAMGAGQSRHGQGLERFPGGTGHINASVQGRMQTAASSVGMRRYMCHACNERFRAECEATSCSACGSDFVEEEEELPHDGQPGDVETLRATTEQLQISPAELLVNLSAFGSATRAELLSSLQESEQSRMQRAFHQSLYSSSDISSSECTPASDGAIASLTRDSAASDECSICLEQMEPENSDSRAALRTPCDHVFHRHCLLSWLRTHNFCPLCQQSLHASASQRRRTSQLAKHYRDGGSVREQRAEM